MNTIIQAYEFKLRQTFHLKSSIAKRVIRNFGQLETLEIQAAKT